MGWQFVFYGPTLKKQFVLKLRTILSACLFEDIAVFLQKNTN